MNILKNRTIALAGLVQAVALIRSIAETGKMPEAVFRNSIQSLFVTHPTDVIQVYGDLSQLIYGLETLIKTISSKEFQRVAQTMLKVMRLQKKISQSAALQKTIAERIDFAKKQVEYFDLTHSNVINNLSDIYLYISNTTRFQLKILGHSRYLGVYENVNRIRALLLAAIRSSLLWHQLGGSRLILLVTHSKIKHMAKTLLDEIKQTTPTVV